MYKGLEHSCAILSPRLSAARAQIICESRGTMTEILTESFCERCGTRYTFESARPRTRLKGVKVLSRGLKNFVLSDDTSIDEAMASARSEAEREASSHQLDAFHKTFNFCMSCRQYTCPNCWNEAEARCLSCAPLALSEARPDFHDLHELRDAVLIGEAAPSNGAPAIELPDAVWPAVAAPEVAEDALPIDVQPEVVDGLERVAQVSEETVGEIEPAPEEPIEAVDEVIAADAGPVVEPGDPGDKAASQTLGLLRRFRPGQSLDAELDAYERERGEAVSAEPVLSSDAPMDDLAALQADRMAAASVSNESAAVEVSPPQEVEAPEPVAAEASVDADASELVADASELVVAEVPEPEPLPAAPEEPAPLPIAAAAASDVVEQPTWRITAPDPTPTTPTAPGGDQSGSVPLQATGAPVRPAGGEPQWPARPEWPSASATSAGLPFLGRPATPEGGIDALWAASNQELVTAPLAPGKPASGIQPCISCGLSLSATARFCRRCGTLQTR